MKSLSDQLTCAQRELELRKRVYPKWVKEGRMTQQKAEHEIECMASIVATVERALWCLEASEEMRRL